jgi:murein DD-endopeptidase MepM/ murein hydrolase activator NlpD
VNPGDESAVVLEEEAVEENPDTDAVNRGDESMAAPEAEVVKKDPDKDAADRRDPEAIAAPYKDYIVTQGPHGFSYGQMAVDLSAGNGAKILSPINGVVTGVYFDEYGNSTLEIENKIYVVTLLHGDYKVDEGDVVKIGEPVGRESNQGYTVNMYGVPCYGRAGCGYHTHLNIYDKRIGSNVNPLDLIGK